MNKHDALMNKPAGRCVCMYVCVCVNTHDLERKKKLDQINPYQIEI